ncbi:hypothetical protein [Sphingomonas sp.]|uniref:hypothetical protein n=1 Tax=Sphingomonas sp. TaxID=28214 RepID=UPI0035A987BF
MGGKVIRPATGYLGPNGMIRGRPPVRGVPTDVLSYVYLWAHEADAGRDEGSKERPVVVVLSTQSVGARTRVIVAPVTTKAPQPGDATIEMPGAVQRQLGLGDDRCWIIASETNSFLWPGPDLRPVRREGDGSPYYGKMPGNLVRQVRELFRQIGAAKLRVTPRSE